MLTIEERLSSPTSGRGRMQRIVLDLLNEHRDSHALPTTVRFLFYELETRGVVRKSQQGESRRGSADDPREQEVTDAATWLRDKGVVPWSWILDEERTLYQWDHARSVADYLKDRLEEATINPWPELPPLVLSESKGLAGVLRAMVSEYVCPIAGTKGQVGGFLHTEIAPLLVDNSRAVFYLGDLDLQGEQIETNSRRVLERETGREIDWTRIAITRQQVAERGLEPIWKTDNRYRPARDHQAVETEALGQATIRAMVREAFDDLLPQPLADVQKEKNEELPKWRNLLDGVDGD